jgi:O-antigen/teichoic acid export membrane protein
VNNLKQTVYSLLRKSEKVFKTDMVYLARGGFWFSFSQVIISLSTLGLAIAFAHFVSKDVYGEYKYILSIVSLLSVLTLTGLGTALGQSISAGFDGTLIYAFWQNIKLSLLFFITFLGIAIYYFFHGNSNLGICMLIVGSLSPILKSTNYYNSYLNAKKDFRRSAIYFGIVGNIFPTLSLLVVMLFTTNLIYLIATYFLSNTLIGMILYRRVVSIYKPSKEIDPNILSYSKHLTLINVLSVIANNIDQILVFHFIGAAELAIYNFAIAIPNQIKILPSTLSNIIFPKFVVRDDKEIRENMRNKQIWLFITGLIIVVGYIFLAPYIYRLLFPKYLESIIYSQITIAPLLFLFFEPAISYLSAKKKIKEQYISSTLTSLFQITVLFVGIIKWGLLGLVIARVLSTIFTYILTGILYEISSRKAVEELHP